MRPKGYKHTPETRAKMSAARRGKHNPFFGKHHSTETRTKLGAAKRGKRNPNFGKHLSIETRAKLSAAKRGKSRSAEHRAKISAATKKRWQDPERRARMSEVSKRLWQDPEQRARTSEVSKRLWQDPEHRAKMSGERNPNWQGGISFEPYSSDWTETLRRSIRERDHYTCRLCGAVQGDTIFAVHHVDYDKKNCDPANLLTLCPGCHSKTNKNREHWTPFFRAMMIGVPYQIGTPKEI